MEGKKFITLSSAYTPSACESCGYSMLQRKIEEFYKISQRAFYDQRSEILNDMNNNKHKFIKNDGEYFHDDNHEILSAYDDVKIPPEIMKQFSKSLCIMCIADTLSFVPIDLYNTLYNYADGLLPCYFSEDGIEIRDFQYYCEQESKRKRKSQSMETNDACHRTNNDAPFKPILYKTVGTSSLMNI